MARLFPFETDISLGDREPKVIDLDGDEADEVFTALSSSTSRQALTLLHEEPRTASALADDLETTLQNVQYHLGKLSDAELIEVADTWYSETGTEMKVYAPTDSALVLFAGEGSTSTLRNALRRLVGAVAVLGLASLVIDRLARRLFAPTAESDGRYSGGGDSGGGDSSREGVDEGDSDGGPMIAEDDDAASGDDAEPEEEAPTEEAAEDAPAEETTSSVEDASADTPVDTPADTPTESPTWTDTPIPEPTPEPSAGDPTIAELYATALEPGALFFLGGLATLALVAGWWYVTRVR